MGKAIPGPHLYGLCRGRGGREDSKPAAGNGGTGLELGVQRDGDWDLTQPRPHAQQACSDRSKQPQPSACTHTNAKPAGRAPPSLAQAVGVAVDDACAASDGAQLPRPARAFQGIQRAAAGLCAVSQA